jgi:hypothetical protein
MKFILPPHKLAGFKPDISYQGQYQFRKASMWNLKKMCDQKWPVNDLSKVPWWHGLVVPSPPVVVRSNPVGV